jgi:short-subunit dehydrogenase
LRAELAPKGVAVSVICPGFVASRMTDKNQFPMPMLMPADRAAAIIMRGLAANRARTAFPGPIYAAMRIMAAMPAALVDPMLRRARRRAQP